MENVGGGGGKGWSTMFPLLQMLFSNPISLYTWEPNIGSGLSCLLPTIQFQPQTGAKSQHLVLPQMSNFSDGKTEKKNSRGKARVDIFWSTPLPRFHVFNCYYSISIKPVHADFLQTVFKSGRKLDIPFFEETHMLCCLPQWFSRHSSNYLLSQQLSEETHFDYI